MLNYLCTPLCAFFALCTPALCWTVRLSIFPCTSPYTSFGSIWYYNSGCELQYCCTFAWIVLWWCMVQCAWNELRNTSCPLTTYVGKKGMLNMQISSSTHHPFIRSFPFSGVCPKLFEMKHLQAVRNESMVSCLHITQCIWAHPFFFLWSNGVMPVRTISEFSKFLSLTGVLPSPTLAICKKRSFLHFVVINDQKRRLLPPWRFKSSYLFLGPNRVSSCHIFLTVFTPKRLLLA